MGRLSTHVLDTANGRPARGVGIDLHRIESDGALALLGQAVTNADGRTDAALLLGATYRPGHYQLSFRVADYFRSIGTALADPPFLDVVVLRFALAEADGHYHVPLLVSPWAYSTYRGS